MTKTTEILLTRMDAHRTELLSEIRALRQIDLRELREEVENSKLSRAKVAGMIMVIAPVLSVLTSFAMKLF